MEDKSTVWSKVHEAHKNGSDVIIVTKRGSYFRGKVSEIDFDYFKVVCGSSAPVTLLYDQVKSLEIKP